MNRGGISPISDSASSSGKAGKIITVGIGSKQVPFSNNDNSLRF